MRGLGFVGRDAELADLGRCLEEVEAGRTTLVLLVGEAGIGKTRLAEEIARVAEQRGLVVAWGRSWEAGGAPAYWPWTEALRGLLRSRPGLARPGPELAAVLPEHAEGAQAAPTDASDARFRLFGAVAELLRQLARGGPMALVLDDLHVADRPSLLLLQFLARALRDLPLLLLGTARERDVALSAEDATLLSSLAREAVWLPIPRLNREQVDALVRGTLEREDPEVTRQVWASTEGNALFVTEMLRLARSRGAVGAWSPTGGVRSTIERRLRALSAEATEALEAASVLGRDFDAGLLAAVLDRGVDALHPHLLEAEASDTILHRGGDRWSFSHVLVREAIYGRLSPARRGRFHSRAADALEREADGGEILAIIAHHRVEARQEVRAAQATIAASDEAMNRLAFEEAVHWLERGCDALRPNAEIWCAELYVRLARARTLAGDQAGGREACEQVAAIARRREDPALLARAALAYGSELRPGLVDADLVRMLEEAASKLPEGPLLALTRARLAAAIQPHPDPRVPIALAREAIASARRLGDPETLRAVLYMGGSAMVGLGEQRERLGVDRELAELAHAAADRVQEAVALRRLAFTQIELGDFASAWACLDRFCEIASRTGGPALCWQPALVHGMRASFYGRFDEAREHRDRAEEQGARVGSVQCRFSLAIYESALVMHEQRRDRAEQTVRRMSQLLSLGVPPAFISVTHMAIAARLEDMATLRRIFAEITDRLVGALEVQISPLVVEAAALMGDHARLARLESYLRQNGGGPERWYGAGAVGFSCEAPTNYLYGVFAQAAGREADARGMFQQAVRTAEAAGFRAGLAHLQVSLAGALLRSGDPADRALAQVQLAEAGRLAEALNQEVVLERVAALCRGPGERAAAAPTAARLGFSLRREGEIWAVSWEGQEIRLKDSRGLQILDQLVREPGRAWHVLELVTAEPEAVDRGDAGAVLDASAIATYKARVRELRADLEEAEDDGDLGRAAKLRHELDWLVSELSRGLGLGGRQRVSGSSAEKARINVQRRLKDAVERIGAGLPAAGRHLARSVRTGSSCVYEPE